MQLFNVKQNASDGVVGRDGNVEEVAMEQIQARQNKEKRILICLNI